MIKSILLFITALVFVWSCCSSDDSDLRGRWQLRNKITPEQSTHYDSLFYSFDNRVFYFKKLHPLDLPWTNEVFGEYVLQADSLIIALKDENQNTPDNLALMQWYAPLMRFRIEELSRSKLVLSDADTLYTFRKF